MPCHYCGDELMFSGPSGPMVCPVCKKSNRPAPAMTPPDVPAEVKAAIGTLKRECWRAGDRNRTVDTDEMKTAEAALVAAIARALEAARIRGQVEQRHAAIMDKMDDAS